MTSRERRLSGVRRFTTAEMRRYWFACWATSVVVSFTIAASETRFRSKRADQPVTEALKDAAVQTSAESALLVEHIG